VSNILSVLILNRNNSEDVITIIDDLKLQSFRDYHVVIIDDNSTQEELAKLDAINVDDVHIFNYPGPWKFGVDSKWSYGLKKAYAMRSKYTYSIQTDMKINSTLLLETLVQHMERDPRCGAASPTLYNAEGIMTWGPGIIKTRMGMKYNINETFITRNELMRRMNYIPSNMIFYGSEYYFINWLKYHGYTTTALGGVHVKHYGGGTTSKNMLLKYFYRPRTTIMLMKIFNRNTTLLMKLRYLRSECWEIENKIKTDYDRRGYFSMIRVIVIFIAGILAGILTAPKIGPQLSFENKHNKK